MDHLWSPWRYHYITKNQPVVGCVFCNLIHSDQDEQNYILYRGTTNFIVLNIFPYTSGHLLIIPFEHLSQLHETSKETSDELMDLTKRCQVALKEEYKPAGFNLGMNLGQAAGAGVAEHLHMHILPRWFGDINFTTSIGETRVMPEDLVTTYRRLKPYFSK